MKSNIRFCLVGRGSIGTRHIKSLKNLSRGDIIAFSESDDKDKDAAFESRYGIRTFHNCDDIKNMKPDAFIIANPTSKHVHSAQMAADMNGHIFMEKPLSNKMAGVTTLKETIADMGLVFLQANNFRFHPVFIKIKQLIEENAFGRLYFARIMAGQYLPDWHPWEDYRSSYAATKALGGGAVLTLQHEIDYAYWLFGQFDTIQSRVKKISNLEIDVEDIATVSFETPSGQLIEIHVDFLQRPPKRAIHIQGSKGSIDYSFGDPRLTFYNFECQRYEHILDLSGYDTNTMYVTEMDHFIQCIMGKEVPRCTIDDAIYVLQTCLAVKGK